MPQRVTLGQLPPHSQVAGLRRRQLSFPEVLAQSVSALAPSAAVVTIPSIVLVRSGAATLPAFAAATGLVLLVGWSLTHFGRRMAAVGGIYSYTAKGLGPIGALLGGWALVIGYATVAMASLVGAVLYLASVAGLSASPPVVAGLGVLVGAAAVLCTVRGIQLSARVALGLEVVSISLVLVVLVVLLLAPHAGDGTAAPVVDGGVHWGGVALGVVLGVAVFMGFESAATLGVEAKRPLISVPRAVLWTPVAVGVLFIAAAAAQVVVLRRAPLDVLTSTVPVAELAGRQGMWWLASLLDVGIAASFFACIIGSTNALARVLFSMGREGALPRALGRTHPRFETPHVALTAVLPAVAGVPLILLGAGADPLAVFTGLLTVSAFGYVVAYLLACLAMPVFLHRIGELTWPTLVAGVTAGGLLFGVLAVAVVGASMSGGGMGLVFASTMAPALGWLWLLRYRAPRRWNAVGVYDQATTGSVLPGSIPDERTR
jgi:amino acid transporter